jgi:chromosome segregation ATPase
MKNAADLNQALQALHRETTKDAETIHEKEAEKKHADDEIFRLTQDLKSLDEQIRQEEQKILQIRQTENTDKKKIDENKKIITQASQQITRLRMESQRANSQLQDIQREYTAALNETKKTGGMGSNNGMKRY